MTITEVQQALEIRLARAGFAPAGIVDDPTMDAVGFRFRPAQADALTMRLPPLTIMVSGIEAVTGELSAHDVEAKVVEALENYYS